MDETANASEAKTMEETIKATKAQNEFTNNKSITSIIDAYNTIAENKLTPEMVTRKNSYNVFICTENVTLIISENSMANANMIEISQEADNDSNVYECFYNFIKSLENSEIEDDILNIYNEIQDKKYSYYNPYVFNDYQVSYDRQQLSNGQYRYRIKIVINNE